MDKKITVSSYLKEYENNKQLKILLKNYCLSNISIDLFFKYYGERVKHDPVSVANFILNMENGFELSILGHRANGESNYYAYNGKSKYRGVICTVGARHSRYHG